MKIATILALFSVSIALIMSGCDIGTTPSELTFEVGSTTGPVAGATVSVTGRGDTTTTQDGTATFTVPKGRTYTYVVTHQEYHDVQGEVHVGLGESQTQTVTLEQLIAPDPDPATSLHVEITTSDGFSGSSRGASRLDIKVNPADGTIATLVQTTENEETTLTQENMGDDNNAITYEGELSLNKEYHLILDPVWFTTGKNTKHQHPKIRIPLELKSGDNTIEHHIKYPWSDVIVYLREQELNETGGVVVHPEVGVQVQIFNADNLTENATRATLSNNRGEARFLETSIPWLGEAENLYILVHGKELHEQQVFFDSGTLKQTTINGETHTVYQATNKPNERNSIEIRLRQMLVTELTTNRHQVNEERDRHVAEAFGDGRWSAHESRCYTYYGEQEDDTDEPPFFSFRLSEPTQIESIGTRMYGTSGGRVYEYKLETSTDGESWEPWGSYDGTHETDTITSWTTITVEDSSKEVKWVRITGYGNDVNGWTHVSRVYLNGERPKLLVDRSDVVVLDPCEEMTCS
ncbi:MAG: discoidin domain-containing protein [Candidatus Woesearchaeota archaeon]